MNLQQKLLGILCIVFLVGNNQESIAQHISNANKLSFISDGGLSHHDPYALKVLKPIKKKVKKAQKTSTRESITTEADLQRIIERQKGLRYRNKRTTSGKCFKSDKDDQCDTK